jgi:hypothetical protein
MARDETPAATAWPSRETGLTVSISTRTAQRRCCGIHLGIGQQASATAGSHDQFKSCANPVHEKNIIIINYLHALRCIKWIKVHAFLKGISSNPMQRIEMLKI